MVLRQTANGKRQRWFLKFVFFSSNPLLNHIKIEKCLLLFATNTTIFTPLFKETKTDGKSFIFAVCRLTYDHVTSNLISLLSDTDQAEVKKFWSVTNSYCVLMAGGMQITDRKTTLTQFVKQLSDHWKIISKLQCQQGCSSFWTREFGKAWEHWWTYVPPRCSLYCNEQQL